MRNEFPSEKVVVVDVAFGVELELLYKLTRNDMNWLLIDVFVEDDFSFEFVLIKIKILQSIINAVIILTRIVEMFKFLASKDFDGEVFSLGRI